MATSPPPIQLEIRLATEKFLASLQGLESKYDGAMKGVASDSDAAAKALEQSFKMLGIKGVQAVEQEVKQLQAALANIRNSPDILPADKAAAVASFNKRLAELRGEAQQTPPALGSVDVAANKTAQSLANAAQKAVSWALAIAGINRAGDLVGQLVETGSEFENLRVRLDNLLGSTEKAETAFNMIKNLAATTPFEVTALTESFVKLTAFGMQPTEAQMRSLSDVAANLGGGTETLSSVTLALGQAWTKSKLQGQEIMQLAERGVPVWDALARATGRSVPELTRMSEAGLLGRDVISKLIDELGRMNAGASDKLMNTYAGSVSNAKDALAEFYDMVSRSGVLEFLTGKVKELLAEFDRMKASGELEAKAKAIADTFIGVADAVESAIKVLVYFGPQIKLVVEAALALKAANMAGTLLSVASGAIAAGTGMTTAGAASATAAVQMETAAVAGGRVATMLRVLRSLTGIGLAIGVAEMTMEFFRAKRAAEEGDAAVRRMLEEKPVNGPKRAAEAATGAITVTVSKADDLVKKFETLTEQGDTAAEAIGKIGKDLDLSSAPGIRDAAGVLDNLLAHGKITAAQFRDAWAGALKDVNLLEFEARARQALDGSAEASKRLEHALDAGLREAIRRAGGDFDVLAGGMGRAAQSSIADTDLIINNLDRLKAQGIDVGNALVQSIGKGINTADSQAAIEAVRTRIEAVRKALGDKVADGLLDQAKQKADELKDALDKATPGINSLREAMKMLGVTSDQTFKDTADKSKAAYEAMKESGTSSARELADGFRKMAADQIAASGEVGSTQRVVTEEVLKSEGAVRGLSVAFDASGKMAVQTQAEAAAAIARTTGVLGGQRDAVDSVTSALERQNAAQERANAAIEKAAELERKRQNVDKEGYMLNTAGERVSINKPTQRSVYENAKGQGLTEAQSLQISNQFIQNGQQAGYGGANAMAGENWGTELQKAIDKLVLANAGKNAETGTPGSPTTTVNVRITLPNGSTQIVPTTQDGSVALIAALQSAKLSSGAR